MAVFLLGKSQLRMTSCSEFQLCHLIDAAFGMKRASGTDFHREFPSNFYYKSMPLSPHCPSGGFVSVFSVYSFADASSPIWIIKVS
jgi:hypothetical protein